MADFVRDLEEVLTYETARAGEATGEATAILSAASGATSRGASRAGGASGRWPRTS